jgi:hypothetical protein
MKAAAFSDPANLFSAGLAGNQRRAIDVFEGDRIDESSLQTLVRAAISYDQPLARAVASRRPRELFHSASLSLIVAAASLSLIVAV